MNWLNWFVIESLITWYVCVRRLTKLHLEDLNLSRSNLPRRPDESKQRPGSSAEEGRMDGAKDHTLENELRTLSQGLLEGKAAKWHRCDSSLLATLAEGVPLQWWWWWGGVKGADRQEGREKQTEGREKRPWMTDSLQFRKSSLKLLLGSVSRV